MDIQRAKDSEVLELAERGRGRDGVEISLDRRIYMQFMVFSGVQDSFKYGARLQEMGIGGVVYNDLNDPYGIGLLTFSERPDDFLEKVHPVLRNQPFSSLQPRPEYTMLGRTYAIGHESNLDEVLLTRPVKRVTDPALPWAIWYPVRRSGAFELLAAEEQRTILMEHGGIGRSFGKADLAYDIRLACFGLDKNDNDFVIGLVGHSLHPLSLIVERMRKTRQTSQYLSRLGPFFVGKVIWQSNAY